jgi:hypothetical protein
VATEAVRSWKSAASASADDAASLPESLRVLCWRLAELSEAGYDEAEAFALATTPAVDLHAATDLLQHGCPHETAVRILL